MRPLLCLFLLAVASALLQSQVAAAGLQVRGVVIQQASTNALDTGLLTGIERPGMLVASSEDPSDVRIWSGRSWLRVGEHLFASFHQWANEHYMTRHDIEALIALSVASPPSLAPLSNTVASVAADLALRPTTGDVAAAASGALLAAKDYADSAAFAVRSAIPSLSGLSNSVTALRAATNALRQADADLSASVAAVSNQAASVAAVSLPRYDIEALIAFSIASQDSRIAALEAAVANLRALLAAQ